MKSISKQSNLFIFELIIAIFFFIICSTICVQLFVRAHTISKETNDQTIAMNYATGYVEEFLNNPSSYQDHQYYYLDKNWKPCSKKHSTYSISIDISQKKTIKTMDVKVYNQKKKIYSLSSDCYIKEELDE